MTHGRLTEVQAQKKITAARERIQELERENDNARAAMVKAKEDLWAILPTAKLYSLAYDTPLKVLDKSAKLIRKNEREIEELHKSCAKWQRGEWA